MNRREFLLAAGSAAFLGGCATARGASSSTVSGAPNIVYILADDMGYGDVGCLNPECKIPTPNMNRLAGEGMVFTDAHSGSAVCTPTRYGILTGRYCWRSTLKSGVLEGHSPALINPQRMTVASLLKSHKYRTACIGKWHLGMNWATTDGKAAGPNNLDYTKPIADGPTALGFDYFLGVSASLDMPPYTFIENDRVTALPTEHTAAGAAPAFFREGDIAPGFKHVDGLPSLTNKATEWIDDHAKNHPRDPFFLYFPLPAPHTPIIPAKEYVGKSGIGPYGDFVCQVDAVVGTVVEALNRNGMADNTLLIVTSDNGCSPMADFPALKKLGHNPSYHFRGHKADIFEGGHRIPLIARWPGHIKPGAACDHLMCLTDLMATTAELVGEKLPDNAGEDSVSMLPVLVGTAAHPAREAVVHHSINGMFSIRQGSWKLECCPGSGGWSDPKDADAKKQGLPPVQLYKLDTDIGERVNVQDKHPGIVASMTLLLASYIAEGRSTPGKSQQNEREIGFKVVQGKMIVE